MGTRLLGLLNLTKQFTSVHLEPLPFTFVSVWCRYSQCFGKIAEVFGCDPMQRYG